ncbi:2,3-bisphosphoglycerate-independent phosphoglycerate mutase [Candidatus Microgenomates bacterium]|nr:2,3-bisphosphoglycerate-independent phosphoglycerate mutase [Candidatus Microgenomates bacterium]
MKKVILIILDGWGLRASEVGNAIKLAKTPNFDRYWHQFPHAVLQASSKAVGLPEGQMGTSEVNHMTIGAGRLLFHDLVRINKSIEDKSFFRNKAIITAFDHVKKHNSTLHIKGLISPGGVHSHQEHVYALLKGAEAYGLKKIYIHVFTDGRDTLPESALRYVQELQDFIDDLGVGKIASVSGRYYAMDRDHNWERTDKTFDLLIKRKGKKYQSASQAIKDSYKKGIADEFIEPVIIEVGPGEEGAIASNDAVVFVNFRDDRPRQLVERFLEKRIKNLEYVTMSQYSPDYQVKVAFPPIEIKNSLGEIISKAGLRQLRVTETEKFAHMTFFLNCKREDAFDGEDRMMLDSYSDIKTHDEKPAMRTADIAQEIIQAMQVQSHEVIFTNLCNGDMIGHTGNLKATIVGVEVIDKAIAKIVEEGRKNNFNILIISDHGNAEEMIDEKTGGRLTAHTINPVPFILISKKWQKLNRDQGVLQDLAPTILKILGLKQPKEMTGRSFI